MRYKIISSFPFEEIINFHKDKEKELNINIDDFHNFKNQYRVAIPDNLALLTIMGAKVEKDQ
jgi:hypothetical protein